MTDKAAIDLKGKRVLVTGATGFIGHHVCRALAAAEADIHGSSRREPSLCPTTEDGWPTMSWHSSALDSAAAAQKLVADSEPQIILHLASLVRGSRDRSLVLEAFEANLASTVYLLDAACSIDCQRFVQVGSLEEPPLTEAPGTPASPYAASKIAASTYARLYRDLYQLPVAIARVFMVYGPGPQDENKLVPYVIKERLAGRDIELSSGSRPVDWIFVEDVARGLLALASTLELPEQPVDLGSGEGHTIREVVRQIYEALGDTTEPPFGTRPDRIHEQVRLANSPSSFETIGWQTEVPLHQGLKRTVEWFASRSET